MTGQGGARLRRGRYELQIWLKSVNHRFFECALRCPPALASLESALTDGIRKRVRRGRIEVEIQVQDVGLLQRVRLNRSLAEKYLALSRSLDRQAAIAPLELFRLPGVVNVEADLPADFPRAAFLAAIDQAVRALQRDRRREGRAIDRALQGQLRRIQQEARRIAAKRKKNKQAQRNPRLAGGAEELPEAERGEVREELDRLQMHLAALRVAIRGDIDAGKRADFLAQEMLREANTIAAKSRDFDIRQAVVEIKTALENIREQARNLC